MLQPQSLRRFAGCELNWITWKLNHNVKLLREQLTCLTSLSTSTHLPGPTDWGSSAILPLFRNGPEKHRWLTKSCGQQYFPLTVPAGREWKTQWMLYRDLWRCQDPCWIQRSRLDWWKIGVETDSEWSLLPQELELLRFLTKQADLSFKGWQREKWLPLGDKLGHRCPNTSSLSDLPKVSEDLH